MKLHPRLRAEGVLAARRGERLRPVAERDGAGWVIGYGHRASAREGARVSDDDAVTLLVYDLSQSAGRVEPLLRRETPPALFDALNAYARRVGPDAFARSDLLRRWNAGEEVTPAQVIAARDRAAEDAGAGAGEGPPSAVLAAADAVRDRLSQMLDAPPEPPPARQPREPWREPPPTSAQPVAAASWEASSALPESGALLVTEPTGPTVAPALGDNEVGASDPEFHGEGEPPPPPFLDAEPGFDAVGPGPAAVEEAHPHDALASPAPSDEPLADLADPALALDPPPATVGRTLSAPVVGFERGGRARFWDRVRGDPRIYTAVGACGVVLFACALVGSALGRPTAFGVALGLVGVLCLAPAIAFFLHRRAPPG